MTSQRRHPGSKQTKQDELLSRHQRGISTDHLRRAKAVQPTLVEIRTQSFTEYINGVLLEKDEELNIINRGDVVGSSEYHATEKHAAKKSKPKKWRHGIVKITLPLGWWDESGIGKDRTARGPAWQEGTKLGDMMVESPIKQHVSGIGGVYEFALLDTPAMTLSQFRDKADKYRNQQLGNKHNNSINDECFQDDHYCDDLAKQFWRRLGPTTPPSIYGADMEGSFFDGSEASGWSLENLDNCLQLLTANTGTTSMPGVTTPYLYFGMWGSVFCVHTEDMNLLSINYLHAGAPKYWYSIPPEHTRRFESLANSHFAHAARDCSEYLRHKQNLLSPTILQKAGIPFEVQIQRPGDAIVTCPGSYHFGVNLGFNVAEATNFGIPAWIPIGRDAKICMCRPNAVWIDVDRFAKLLDKYESDIRIQKRLGNPAPTYREWTLAQGQKNLELIVKDVSQATDMESNQAPVFQSKDEEFWIEVVQPLPSDGSKRLSLKKDIKGSKSKRKMKNGVPAKEEWRLAKPLDPKKLQLEDTVLCLLPSRKDGQGPQSELEEEEECFVGTVKEFADNHCRVHFRGLKRGEDVWFDLYSNKLFRDGGVWESPTSKDKYQESELYEYSVISSKNLQTQSKRAPRNSKVCNKPPKKAKSSPHLVSAEG